MKYRDKLHFIWGIYYSQSTHLGDSRIQRDTTHFKHIEGMNSINHTKVSVHNCLSDFKQIHGNNVRDEQIYEALQQLPG